MFSISGQIGADAMRMKLFLFLADEGGATAVEYGLLVGLIGVVIIVGAATVGARISGQFDIIAAALH
jgi:pilus assembly protein Flp/PilA